MNFSIFYPERFLDHCFRTFLSKVFHCLLIKQHAAPKLQFSLVLPFTGNHGLQIRKQLLKIVSSAYPHISLRIVFRPVCRISSFFRFKVRIPMRLRSNVVYKFTCQSCHALCIGKTCRNLHTRVCEHMGISAYTGNEISSPAQLSSIYSHTIRKLDTRFRLKISLFFLLVFLSLRSFLEKVYLFPN